LQPGVIVYNGSPVVDEYTISNRSIFKTQVCGADYIYGSLTFQRSLLGFFLTVCLPTLISIFIGHTTNYFGEKRFDVAIGVNLTLLLVLTTM
jgi:hypothetical protein